MSMSINTNVASLNAQRNLSGSQSALSTSLQRLSSGARINSAKDDAAGLAISERMGSQIRGLDQARRNANDGISLAQTAEGGMTSASDMLQRMRELAVQSANDTNSDSDRKAIQSEVNQLKEELNRLVDTTQFNGKNILDGTMSNAQFQVGANAQQTINVSVSSIRGTDIGNYQAGTLTTASKMGVASTAAAASPANGVATGMDFVVAGNGKTATIDVGDGESAKGIAAKVNTNSGSTGVSATAETKATVSGITAGTVSFKLTGDNDTAPVTISASVGSDIKSLAEAVNAQTATTGISAKVDKNGALELSNKNGADIKIADYTHSDTAVKATVKGANDATGVQLESAANDSTTISGTISFDSTSAFSINAATAGVVAASTNAGLSAVDKVDLSSAPGANAALKVLDAALATVNSRRADLGAVQNRFSNTISNLQSSAENLNASRGRILDTDFASETAKMSRNQVLQQAGTAMLAQANQLPQQVLQLLR
ncbi:flagellin [Aquitalea sp. S1-19]|nr:flagellin [Aquitalea sp. S1-19]